MIRRVLPFAVLILFAATADAAPMPKYPPAIGLGSKPHYPPAMPSEYTIKELKPAGKPKTDASKNTLPTVKPSTLPDKPIG